MGPDDVGKRGFARTGRPLEEYGVRGDISYIFELLFGDFFEFFLVLPGVDDPVFDMFFYVLISDESVFSYKVAKSRSSPSETSRT